MGLGGNLQDPNYSRLAVIPFLEYPVGWTIVIMLMDSNFPCVAVDF